MEEEIEVVFYALEVADGDPQNHADDGGEKEPDEYALEAGENMFSEFACFSQMENGTKYRIRRAEVGGGEPPQPGRCFPERKENDKPYQPGKAGERLFPRP